MDMSQYHEDISWFLRTYRLLGHTSYYRVFLKNYVNIVAPLIALLKNNASIWDEAMHYKFSTLKYAMCTTLILGVPNFTKNFVLEFDTLVLT